MLCALALIACASPENDHEAWQALGSDIKRIRTRVQEDVFNQLLLAKERGPRGRQFAPNDGALTEKLSQAAIVSKEPMGLVVQAMTSPRARKRIDSQLARGILQFYSQAEVLQDAVDRHVEAATQDARALTAGSDRRNAAKPDKDRNAYIHGAPYRFAVLIETPTKSDPQARFGARIVEVGPPICEDRKAPEVGGKCPGTPIGFAARDRFTSGEAWRYYGVAAPNGASVESAKLIPLIPSEVFEALIKGDEASAAEALYMRRLAEIQKRCEDLTALGLWLESNFAGK